MVEFEVLWWNFWFSYWNLELFIVGLKVVYGGKVYSSMECVMVWRM